MLSISTSKYSELAGFAWILVWICSKHEEFAKSSWQSFGCFLVICFFGKKLWDILTCTGAHRDMPWNSFLQPLSVSLNVFAVILLSHRELLYFCTAFVVENFKILLLMLASSINVVLVPIYSGISYQIWRDQCLKQHRKKDKLLVFSDVELSDMIDDKYLPIWMDENIS